LLPTTVIVWSGFLTFSSMSFCDTTVWKKNTATTMIGAIVYSASIGRL
jgi:hypothetical protein